MKNHYDPVYGNISIVDEGTDVDIEYYSARERDTFERLSHIKQLGVISYIFTTAKHTKLEHSLGVYHLSSKLGENKKMVGYDRIPVRRASLIHSIGQLSFTISCEKAILKSSYLFPHLHAELSKMIETPFQFSKESFCKECKKDCYKNLVKGYDRPRIFRCLSAGSFLQKIKNSNHEKNTIDIIKTLICEKSINFDILRYLNRLDYVLRDLHSIGMTPINVLIDPLLQECSSDQYFRPPIAESKIINSLEGYLFDKMYGTPISLMLENYFENRVCLLLGKNEISIEELLNFTDDDLIARIPNCLEDINRIRSKFEQGEYKKVFSYNKGMNEKYLLDYENKLLKLKNPDPLKTLEELLMASYHICFSERPDNIVSVHVLHDFHTKELIPLVEAYKRIETYEDSSKILLDLIKYIFQQDRIELGKNVKSILMQIIRTQPDILQYAKTVKSSQRIKLPKKTDIIFKFKGEKPISIRELDNPASELFIQIRTSNKKIRSSDIDEFNEQIANHIILQSHLYEKDFIKKMARALNEINGSNGKKGIILETKIFLRDVLTCMKGRSYHISIPGVIFFHNDGKQKSELDLLSISLNSNGKMIIETIESTTSEKEGKHEDDIRSAIYFKNEIQKNFRDANLIVIPKVIGTRAVEYESHKDIEQYIKQV